MINYFYKSPDEVLQGPFSEAQVQLWYAHGNYNSGTVFEIAERDDSAKVSYTLGELIDLNGRHTPFFFSRQERSATFERSLQDLKKEIDSIRADLCHYQTRSATERNDFIDLESRVTSLVEQISALTSKSDKNDSRLSQLMDKVTATDVTMKALDERISTASRAQEEIRDNLRQIEKAVSDTTTNMESIRTELEKFGEQQTMKSEEKSDEVPPWDSVQSDNAVPVQSESQVNDGTKKKKRTRSKKVKAVDEEKIREEKEESIRRVEEERAMLPAPTLPHMLQRTQLPSPMPGIDPIEAGAVMINLAIAASPPEQPKADSVLFDDFVGLLDRYVQALYRRPPGELEIHMSFTPHGRDGISLVLCEMRSDSARFEPLATRLLLEMKRHCDQPFILECTACRTLLFSPYFFLDHFTDPFHVEEMKRQGQMTYLYAMIVQRMLAKVSNRIKRPSRQQREGAVLQRGLQLQLSRTIDAAEHRPTAEFARQLAADMLRTELWKGDSRISNDEAQVRLKTWFKNKQNRDKFKQTLDEHLKTGVPYCEACLMGYETIDDFYKHYATYVHATHCPSRVCFIATHITLCACEENGNKIM